MNDNQLPKRIFRCGAPGKLDKAPFGTECVATQTKILYRQISHDEEQPNWILIGLLKDIME